MGVYLAQAIVYAYTTISNLDEGAYLLKGFLFATDQYQPFDPGISTNKAPLAFLIPGYVQLLFGPGLRTGRLLAVFFGLMAVVGTWLAARRLGGRWLAVGAVLGIASGSAIIKIYSMGVTQSTIACLLAWSLALVLGEKRPVWQLILSGVLAGLMILVRQNMLPVLPLLIVYAFWQHGRRAFWLFVPGVMVVAYSFYIYWPHILQLWTWVPLVKIPSEVLYGGGGVSIWNPEISVMSRWLSIFQAVRFHFIALFGSIVAFLFWVRPSRWRSIVEFRIGAALFALFWGLFYMHFVAAIALDYCVFCFKNYIAFFNVAGILLLVVSVGSWNWRIPVFTQVFLVALSLIVFSGIGYSAFEDIGSFALGLPAPRMRDMRILPGLITWWDILSQRFDLDVNSAKKYAAALFGLFAGGLFICLMYIGWQRTGRHVFNSINFGAFYASSLLIAAILFSPILGGSYGKPDCRSNVILANEQIGEHLSSIIPLGSVVYWNGGLSTVPLLYLPGVKIFPAQINNGYSFISGGDSHELYRFGYWNEEMDAEWRTTADFFIIEEWRYPEWKQFLSPAEFDEYARTPVGTSCLEETRLRIFKRKE
ncbi:MAG: glycosyltransferase family 39 protein [Anaerolineales bacterium]|nr:glycosyltransferase family 39 protein [Anaerolineales bacterium]